MCYYKHMENNYEDLKIQIGKNISEYRKVAGLSQIDFAEKLNYSDKAVSKWERGESLPDIVVLKQIADMFGITVNDLISYKDIKRKKLDLKKLLQNKIFVLILSIGLVWLISTIFFVFALIFNILPNHSWLMFIYALPVSFIICVVFTAIWKNRLFLTISESMLVFTIVLSLCLSVHYSRIWYLFLIAIPLEILILLWNLMKRKKWKKV